MCGVQWLVENSERLLQIANGTPYSKAATHAILRLTIFPHFCAGESVDEAVPVLQNLRSKGIGGILDCAVEADVPSEGSVSEGLEAAAEQNFERLLESIAATQAVAAGSEAFVAAKLTALANPADLKRAAELIAGSVPADGAGAVGGPLPPGNLAAERAPAEALALLGPAERRVRALAAAAKQANVQLLIDAEQTYFQPAIDALTLRAMRDFNTGGRAVVYATYQAYLVAAEERLKADLAWAEANDVHFAVKLVRGAYMVSERRLARQEGRPSPVQPTAEATHACYDACLATLVAAAARGRGAALLATHNVASVAAALAEMRRRGVPPEGGGVHFGQLYGMADHLSYTLGGGGYSVAKYLPYGPVEEVMPYLVRRAQENSAVLGGAAEERALTLRELLRRAAAPLAPAPAPSSGRQLSSSA